MAKGIREKIKLVSSAGTGHLRSVESSESFSFSSVHVFACIRDAKLSFTRRKEVVV